MTRKQQFLTALADLMTLYGAEFSVRHSVHGYSAHADGVNVEFGYRPSDRDSEHAVELDMYVTVDHVLEAANSL